MHSDWTTNLPLLIFIVVLLLPLPTIILIAWLKACDESRARRDRLRPVDDGNFVYLQQPDDDNPVQPDV